MDKLIDAMSKSSLEDKHSPSKMLVDIIAFQTKKEQASNIWSNSLYKDLRVLQANNVGNVGEMLIQSICEKHMGTPSAIDGTKTRHIGGGTEGDGQIKNKSIEIKTSLLGSKSLTFQHELGEYPWNVNYMVFVDIAPKDVYITIFKNFNEEQYKEHGFKCKPYFPTKSITQRKGTSPSHNELCVKNGYSIKLTDNNIDEIGDFINKTIT